MLLKSIAGGLMLAALVAAAPSHAADELNVVPGFSAGGAPLAVHGYDPVAYFTDGRPMRGSDKHVHVHDGAAYRFASAEHLAAFKADPAKYTPQYGGFCAYGVAVGKKFDGDPHYWTVSDGKLYLNLNEDISAEFNKDVAGSVAKADANWPGIRAVAASKL